MTYVVRGLDPTPFRPFFAMEEEELDSRRARLVEADSPTGFPCRVSLADARPGERLLLVHHVSHEAETPFRSAFAIYVREAATEPARHVGALPPALDRRTLTLRGYDSDGMLLDARLAGPGEADQAIRDFFERAEMASIHLHAASPGCFLARAERRS